MRTKLVRIGNSRGVRLPKPILEASGITDEVDLTVEGDRVILMRPEKHPRAGWAEAIDAIGPDDEDWSDWQNMPCEALEEDWTWPEDFKWPEEEIVVRSTSPSLIQSAASKSQKPGPASSSRRRK